MIELIKRAFSKRYGFPIQMKNVWYNYGVHSKGNYPIVFDENKKYIECEIGTVVQMGETYCNKKVFYKVVKMWRTRGSDFLYPSDAINCDMVFDHVE